MCQFFFSRHLFSCTWRFLHIKWSKLLENLSQLFFAQFRSYLTNLIMYLRNRPRCCGLTEDSWGQLSCASYVDLGGQFYWVQGSKIKGTQKTRAFSLASMIYYILKLKYSSFKFTHRYITIHVYISITYNIYLCLHYSYWVCNFSLKCSILFFHLNYVPYQFSLECRYKF